MAVTERIFGQLKGKPVMAYALAAGGISLDLIGYGARLRQCLVPDVTGRAVDVVPGFDTLEDYVTRGGSTGAVCGRYGNRIDNGQFVLDGVLHQLSINDPPHSLHGGFVHFGKKLWLGEAIPHQNAVRFTLASPDGDEGWPGNVDAEVTYSLTDQQELTICMRAKTDQPTYVNMIFHGYWNLAGHGAGSVDRHLLRIEADTYLPKNARNLPSGERRNVAGTPFDFRKAKPIGEEVAATGGGYDHNLCLVPDPKATRPIVKLGDPTSGRAMTLATNQPGVHVYTADSWHDVRGKDGVTYQSRPGVAFETQQFPNTPNIASFDPRPLRPGQVYEHTVRVMFNAVRPDQLITYLNS